MRRLPLCLALLGAIVPAARAECKADPYICAKAAELVQRYQALKTDPSRQDAPEQQDAAKLLDEITQLQHEFAGQGLPGVSDQDAGQHGGVKSTPQEKNAPAANTLCPPLQCVDDLKSAYERLQDLNARAQTGTPPSPGEVNQALAAYGRARHDAMLVAGSLNAGFSAIPNAIVQSGVDRLNGYLKADLEAADAEAAGLKAYVAQTGGASPDPKGAPGSPDRRGGPVSPQVRVGQQSLDQGHPEQAVQAADQAIKNNANDGKAYALKAEALEKLGRKDEAAAAARRAAERDPEAAKLLDGHGASLSKASGVSAKARGLSFGAASDLGSSADPGGKASYAAASMVGFAAGAPPAPPSGLSMNAAKSPSQLLVEKAWQKLRLGDKTGALLAATEAIDSDPKNTWAWTIRSEIENTMGKFPLAELDATRAVAVDAANARAYRARAYAELEEGKLDAALADAEKAISLDPGNGLGYLYRAMALEKLGRTAEALADYQKAVALDPTLHALADDAIARLSGKSAPATSAYSMGSLKRPLVRGGMIAGSLLLVLLGLLTMTPAGRALTTRSRARRSEATAVAPARAELAAGMTLAGNYRLERELGRGGMGVVFEAFDQALQRRVAIKKLQRDGDAERFLQEARLVAKLKHPNLAEIYNVIDDGELLLVFEYVDGQPLDRTLALSRKLPPASAAEILSGVCAGLAFAHGQRVVHRDLKPSNVMLGRDGKPKILDFGVAHQSRSGATLTLTSAAGTPPYMAPEQALGSSSKASDLYALAVMAYEMVTGARPFEGPDFLEQKLQRRFSLATTRDAALKPSLDAFFMRALEPDPTKRHADAAAFARAFSEAAA